MKKFTYIQNGNKVNREMMVAYFGEREVKSMERAAAKWGICGDPALGFASSIIYNYHK